MVLFVLLALFAAFGGMSMTPLIRQARTLIEKLDRARNRGSEPALIREQVRCADDLYEIREQTLHAVEDQVALAENLPGGEGIRVHVDRVDEADTGAVNCSARSCGRSPLTSCAAPGPDRCGSPSPGTACR